MSPKNAVSAWIVAQRKAQPPEGWKSEELARRLGVSDSTVRGWEAGRKPKPENIAALERLFDVTAPGHIDEPSDLAAALIRQAEAMEAQAIAFTLLARSIDNAATGVVARVAGFDEALTDLLKLVRGQQPTNGDAPVGAGTRTR